MALFTISNISFDGLACAVPNKTLDNKDYPYHNEKENNQFLKTTGIRYRSIVEPGTTASDLCFSAANKLLTKMNIDKNDINVLIFLSQTPDYKIPCTATILQDRLNIGRHCLAFDVNLGCSGYVYGLSIISSLLQQIKGRALLLVGDTSSTCVSQKDKSSAPLFSDAGSATMLTYNEHAADIHYNLQSDGKGFDAIISKDGGSRNPINSGSLKMDESTSRRPVDMYLDGIKVFNFSRKEVVPNIEILLNHYAINKDSIDHFVFHQANLFMNESIRKKLDLAEQRVPYSLNQYGNTSSASIPVTMVHSLRDKISTGKHSLILSGFGVGLSWGSAKIDLVEPVILPMIKV